MLQHKCKKTRPFFNLLTKPATKSRVGILFLCVVYHIELLNKIEQIISHKNQNEFRENSPGEKKDKDPNIL